jgi:phosphomannomutase
MIGEMTKSGMESEPGDETRCLVYYNPNQIYFMLLAYRLELLAEAGGLDEADWLLLETYPTSRSLAELARWYGLPVFFTPVGFKHFGQSLRLLEEQMKNGEEQLQLTDSRGKLHKFRGPLNILLMAEESGGAAWGGSQPMTSRSGANRMLALKEKDAFQVGVTAMALAAELKLSGSSFARFYLDRLDKYRIHYHHYQRRDVTLFDESLKGPARETARTEGNRRKESAVRFFRNLADRVFEGELNPGQVTRILQERCGTSFVFPPVQEIFWAGDGTFIQFEGMWWQLRASGTDAVLRYYAEGDEKMAVRVLNDAMLRLDVD